MKNATLEIKVETVPAFFTPEMGDARPAAAQIVYKCSYGGGFYVTVEDDSIELIGRGIRQSGTKADHKRGKATYHVTSAAMDKLEAKYICCFESML